MIHPDSLLKVAIDTLVVLPPHGGPDPGTVAFVFYGAVIVAVALIGLAIYGIYSIFK